MIKSAVTIGKFDGCHLGHQVLLEDISGVSKSKGYRAVCCKLLMGGSRILSFDEGKKLVEEMFPEIKEMVPIQFTPEFAAMSPKEFVENILVKQYNVGYVAVGNDFRFGKDRAGDTDTLISLGREFDFEVNVIPKLKKDDEIVSSTRIKKHLASGEMKEADALLNYEYMISGSVEHGKKLGRSLGFPTINLIPGADKLLPRFGVYASKVQIGDKSYRGITNIGIRPSIDDGDTANVETFIYDFNDDIYGSWLEIIPETFIRSEMKFQSLDELKSQIDKDISAARKSEFTHQ